MQFGELFLEGDKAALIFKLLPSPDSADLRLLIWAVL